MLLVVPVQGHSWWRHESGRATVEVMDVPSPPTSSTGNGAAKLTAAFLTVVAVLAALAIGVGAGSATWNVQRVGGPVSDGGAVVAVVDTGVDATHPVFDGRVLPQLNVAGGDGDGHGHGTHVAGIAAGGSVDCGGGPVTVGVASGVTILPVRVLDARGRGSLSTVAAGIRAATDAGADVINLSLGPELGLTTGLTDTSEFTDAVRYAWQEGAVPVLAAGNENGNILRILYPAGYGDLPAVIVTATTKGDARASYADTVGNARWGIAAPGGAAAQDVNENVLSAWPGGGCAHLSGTSMAAPHVAGGIALLRARGFTAEQAVDRLLETATPLAASGTGHGLMNLQEALKPAAAQPVPRPSTTAPSATTTTTAAANEQDPQPDAPEPAVPKTTAVPHLSAGSGGAAAGGSPSAPATRPSRLPDMAAPDGPSPVVGGGQADAGPQAGTAPGSGSASSDGAVGAGWLSGFAAVLCGACWLAWLRMLVLRPY